MAKTFPARLHVVSAREAPISVIFRRGPSKKVCTILWDRRNDSFTLGQWLKGRIYERKADISPDGKYLIYFAMGAKLGGDSIGTWTAISRVPWLRAIAFFAEVGTYEGGGLFTSNDTYWIYQHYGNMELLNTDEVRRDTSFQLETPIQGGETNVYYPRLIRDGWIIRGREERGEWNAVSVFEKSLPNDWVLRKIAHEQVGAPVGKGCYWDEHELVNPSGEIMKKPNWEWADLDGTTLVWAERGALYRGTITGVPQIDAPRLLQDFTGMTFEAIKAPY